mmetsp:Transcript_11524/g.22118  ORF Transcript_11524/g.22118 Transcript_11524/m.22118 type:complete len:173 (-) Transcript_11524:249-767(-)
MMMLGGGESKSKDSNTIQCLTNQGFKSLCDITCTFLDVCGKMKDYKSPIVVMTVSNVFYTELKKSRRQFLADVIQKHQFWKKLSFWRAILKAAVMRKMLKNRYDDVYYSFIQGWLVENLHKMVMFNVDIKDLQVFVDEVMLRHNLPVRRKQEIQDFVDRMKMMHEALNQINK